MADVLRSLSFILSALSLVLCIQVLYRSKDWIEKVVFFLGAVSALILLLIPTQIWVTLTGDNLWTHFNIISMSAFITAALFYGGRKV